MKVCDGKCLLLGNSCTGIYSWGLIFAELASCETSFDFVVLCVVTAPVTNATVTLTTQVAMVRVSLEPRERQFGALGLI